MSELPPPSGEVRSIQLSAGRAYAVLPSADSDQTQVPVRDSWANRRCIKTKLWLWRRWVGAEFQWKGLGRIKPRWIETRLRGYLWLIRIRRLSRRASRFQSNTLKAVPAKPIP